ncbi:MAG: hypothetical protein J6Y29_03390 [Clostridiales bacterium]|nr:hypothetical protein [Clostridiales bacterium]
MSICDKPLRGLKRIFNSFRKAYRKFTGVCKKIINAIRKTFNFSIDLIKKIFALPKKIVDTICKSKKYIGISLTSLGAIAGASIATVFGLGLFSATNLLFPKMAISTWVATASLIAVPVAGIAGGIGTSVLLGDIFSDNNKNVNQATSSYDWHCTVSYGPDFEKSFDSNGTMNYMKDVLPTLSIRTNNLSKVSKNEQIIENVFSSNKSSNSKGKSKEI